MRCGIVALSLALIVVAGETSAQCVVSLYPNNYAASVGVGQGFGISAGDISAAIGMWETCSSFETGFPALLPNASGTMNVTVQLIPGAQPSPVGGCGHLDPQIGANGAIVGGTIFVYETLYDGTSCEPTRTEVIAHELGHFLGLDDSTCSGRIMSGNNMQAGSRSVGSDECSRVDQQWQTPSEPPPPDPDPGDINNCQSPLVLDLNGDGIHTTGLDWPVLFDIDGNRTLDTMAWTDPTTAEGFLWLDLNSSGEVDGGGELFGVGMHMPDGKRAPDGFEALRVYDRSTHGGNADGSITRADRVWAHLRIWVDGNHDGISQRDEIRPMQAHGVVSIRLTFVIHEGVEENGNERRFRGTYEQLVKRNGRLGLTTRAIEDIFFRVLH